MSIEEEFEMLLASDKIKGEEMYNEIKKQSTPVKEKRVFDISKYNLKPSFNVIIEDVTPAGYGLD